MDNPLRTFVPVEDRDDGVYVNVAHGMSETLRIDDIADALKRAFVTNCDIERLREVLRRESGGFERIGPPFEYYNPDLDKYVDVKATPMSASATLSSIAISNEIRATETSLLFCLRRKGIVFGVKHEAVREMIAKTIYDREVVIAEGRPPVDGENATLTYEIDPEKKSQPLVEHDGKVDYRNVHSFVQVVAGQVIARKVAPGKGTPGMDVRGQQVAATAGQDIKVKPGKNVLLSDDGACLKAAKSGYVYKTGDIVNVGELLTVKKDVDFSVGNIKYSGDVKIDGNVLPGFTVETDGNIGIKGEAESARIISRNGSVVIDGGVVGKNDMVVTAKKDVTLEFAQSAMIRTDGVLHIGKYCMHCDIVCDAVVGGTPHAAIIGGSLTAFSKIEIETVGNDKGVETKLSVVDKEEKALGDKIGELELLGKKLSEEIEPIKRQLKGKAAILKQLDGQPSQRQVDEMRKWLDIYNKLAVKLKYVREKTALLTAELSKPRTYGGTIKIHGDVFPGTELNLYGMTRVIKMRTVNKLFRIRDGSIAVEG